MLTAIIISLIIGIAAGWRGRIWYERRGLSEFKNKVSKW